MNPISPDPLPLNLPRANSDNEKFLTDSLLYTGVNRTLNFWWMERGSYLVYYLISKLQINDIRSIDIDSTCEEVANMICKRQELKANLMLSLVICVHTNMNMHQT